LGRYIIAKIQIDDKRYVFVNVYAPNKDKDSIQFLFQETVYSPSYRRPRFSEDNILLGGDFNCPFNPNLDKHGGVMIPRKVVIESIGCLQDDLGLVDIWRAKTPETKSYILGAKNHPQFFVA